MSGGVISGLGTLSGDLGGNQTTTSADIVNGGTIEAKGGDLLVYGDITGSGTLSIASGATMTLEGSVASGQTVQFSPHATLVIADPRRIPRQDQRLRRQRHAGDRRRAGDRRDLVGRHDDHRPAVRRAAVQRQPETTAPASSSQANGLGGSTLQANPSTVGGGEGDVHMTTFDGLKYDFQAVGDFVVTQSTDPANPWEIQMRTTSWGGAVSVTQVLGTEVGDEQVTFAVGRDNTVHIDGVADTALQVGDVQQLGNDDG